MSTILPPVSQAPLPLSTRLHPEIRDVCVLEQNVLLNIEGHQRQVQQQRNPIPIDKEQEGQEAVDSRLGDDVGVKAVAEVDGVDVVAVIQ